MGLALVAVFALSAVVAASAMAEKPEFSPAEGNAFTTAGGAAKFEQKEGIAAVTAEKSEGKGEVQNAKEGTFDELYLGTKAPLAGKCTGLNDTVVGSVLAKGKFKIGYLDAAKTKVGVVFKVEPVHFECEKLITLITVEGAAIGVITPLNTKTKTFTATLKIKAAGVNEFTEILNATNTAFETFTLKSEINGAAAKQAAQETTVTITTTKEATIVA
jgi:hypothetical protein